MAFSYLESLNVHHLTSHQPFCAGIVLIHHGCLVVTLNTDGLPARSRGQIWRAGGLGGGQEPGETIWECALREAREELCSEVELVASPRTYFHDIDTGDLYEVACTDSVAPLLLERQSNLYPYTPYRPGLPSGPYTYFGIFLAQLRGASIQPGDDVEGLLLIPLTLWPLLLQQPSLGTMLQQGASVIENTSLPRTRKLWVSPDESFRTVVPLLIQHPELLR